MAGLALHQRDPRDANATMIPIEYLRALGVYAHDPQHPAFRGKLAIPMLRVAVQPAPPMHNRQSPLPPSPFAFFAENDVLRIWLRALNTVVAAYCVAMVALLTADDTTCSGRTASFYCDPRVGTTRFALALRNTHAVLAIYLGFCSWHLRFPRRCVVLLNVVTLAIWGLAMVSLGISQCVVASESTQPTATLLVGVQLILLGLVTTIGGGVGGWKYHRRRMIEMLVVVDVLFATQQ